MKSQHQNPQNPHPAPKQHRLVAEPGQVYDGKVSGFALSKDRSRREGFIIRFPGGASEFVHATQVGSHFPESRLNNLQVGNAVRVELRVSPDGRRSFSEKLVFLGEVAQQLEGGAINLNTECLVNTKHGAFMKITTPGPAFGMTGLLQLQGVPGGRKALEAIKPGAKLVLDITKARVDREKGALRITLDGHGVTRREFANRFPAGIELTANVSSDNGDFLVLKLKGGEICRLPKSELNGANLDKLKPGTSTKAYVTGVDANGVILLSKVMPE